MIQETFFDQLDSQESTTDSKRLLREHLIEQLKIQEQHPDESEQIAYHIAGLMATNFARSLPDNDPYEEVLVMAGQLELPPSHRDSGATWENFRRLVDKLDFAS